MNLGLGARPTKDKETFSKITHWTLFLRNLVVFWLYNYMTGLIDYSLCTCDSAEEVKDLGVNVALSMLKFYKRKLIFFSLKSNCVFCLI